MTRWKSERTTTIMTLHAHNRWSRYYDAKIMALEEMNIPYSSFTYRLWDGSLSKDYYVPARMLEKFYVKYYELVDKYHERLMGIDP